MKFQVKETKEGKKKTSFLIGNLNCWRQSLSLGIFCISHTQNRCAISPITYLQSCSNYLVLSVLLMTQAIPDRAKATEEVQDTSYPRGSNATVFESFSERVSNTNSMEFLDHEFLYNCIQKSLFFHPVSKQKNPVKQSTCCRVNPSFINWGKNSARLALQTHTACDRRVHCWKLH